MNKSLLRILEAEQKVLDRIDGCEYCIGVYRNALDAAEALDVNNKNREPDIKFYQQLIVEEKMEMERLETELESIKSEMRDYFAELFEKGGENNG